MVACGSLDDAPPRATGVPFTLCTLGHGRQHAGKRGEEKTESAVCRKVFAAPTDWCSVNEGRAREHPGRASDQAVCGRCDATGGSATHRGNCATGQLLNGLHATRPFKKSLCTLLGPPKGARPGTIRLPLDVMAHAMPPVHRNGGVDKLCGPQPHAVVPHHCRGGPSLR